jgi:outer membrane protein OmpA-like peptidoglycan-associated protein
MMIHGKKSNRLTFYSKMIILSAILGLVASGCAAPRENIALKQAKEAYANAKEDPNVMANASVPLYEAGRTLKNAEMATSEDETNHLAYMAEKQTAIAVATAQQKLAEDERQKLAKEKDQIVLEQKERQARKARGEAEEYQKRAETALAQTKKLEQEAETALAQTKKLEQELSALKAEKTDRGYVLTLGDVLFATGKAELMSGAQRTIDQLAAFLNKYPTRNVSVEGHTDSVGSEDYNLMLSQRRAESVRFAIMARGISSDRITARGMGELYPVASNDTPAGRQQNRRVEILIISSD